MRNVIKNSKRLMASHMTLNILVNIKKSHKSIGGRKGYGMGSQIRRKINDQDIILTTNSTDHITLTDLFRESSSGNHQNHFRRENS